MKFTACAVAVFPRQRLEVGTGIRAKLGQDITQARRILLDLLAQLVYHHAKVLRLLAVVRSPDSLQQFFVRKRFPLLSDEKSQHIEFFGTEMDALTTHVHYSSPKIDTQLPAVEFRKRFFRTGPCKAARIRARSSPDGERFYYIVVGSGIESMNLVLLRISDGDHDDRPAEGRSNLAACLKPVHAGHVHIQQNQIRALADNHFDGFLPVLRQYDVIAVTRKHGSQNAANLWLVVRHEDGCVGHRLPEPREQRTSGSEYSVRNGTQGAIKKAWANRKDFIKPWLFSICSWAGCLLPAKRAESKSARGV
jgi:hypothetical protein